MGAPLKLPFEPLQMFIANAAPPGNPSFESLPCSIGQVKVEADVGMLKIWYNLHLSLQKTCWLPAGFWVSCCVVGKYSV